MYVAFLLLLSMTVGSDFSGVDRYFEVAEILMRDQDPSDEDWERLFESPGYAVMKERDRSDRLLKTLLPLALKPSRAAERDAIPEDAWQRTYIAHYRGASDVRESLGRVRQRLANSDLAASALELAAAWLPSSALSVRERPDVAFVILEPDARGYDPIVVDLLLARDLGDGFVPLLAHEMHHVYRNAVTVVRRPDGDFPERLILRAIDNLHAEGVADQIDKDRSFTETGHERDDLPDYFNRIRERYVAGYVDAAATIVKVDALLGAYGDGSRPADEVGGELNRELVLGGHPVGFYMANAIIEAFGRERVVENIADPFAFVRDYDAAARRLADDRPSLSAQAIDAIDQLDRRFGRLR